MWRALDAAASGSRARVNRRLSPTQRAGRSVIIVLDAKHIPYDFADRRAIGGGAKELLQRWHVVPARAGRTVINVAAAGPTDRRTRFREIVRGEERSRKNDPDIGSRYVRRWRGSGYPGLACYAVMSKLVPLPAACYGQLAVKGDDRAHDDAEPVAEHAAGRQAFEFRAEQRAVDREQGCDLVGSDARSVVAHDDARQVAVDRDAVCAGIERVVDELLRDDPPELAGLTPRFLRQCPRVERKGANRRARTGSGFVAVPAIPRRSRIRRIRSAAVAITITHSVYPIRRRFMQVEALQRYRTCSTVTFDAPA